MVGVVGACVAAAFGLLGYLEQHHESAVLKVHELVIPPGRELMARRLVKDVGFMAVVDGGLVLNAIRIEETRVVYEVRRQADGPEGPIAGRVTLSPRPKGEPGQAVSQSFAITTEAIAPDPAVSGVLARVVASVQRHDQGSFYVQATGGARDGPGAEVADTSLTVRQQVVLVLQLLGGLALLLLASVVVRGRGAVYEASFHFKLTHLLPALLQVVLYGYWSLYWAGVGDYLPLLAMHVVFAVLLDALLGLGLRRSWRVTFGPLPIVLSTGLFVWFVGAGAWVGFLAISVALVSKHALHWRGRHVFNPSALGISVVGVLSLLWPQTFPYTDIASELNLPPNMTEVVLIVALVVQLRLPIVLVSLSSFAALWSLHWFGWIDILQPTWPAVFLALTLLATDPSTSPRTAVGRVLFGVLVGLGFGVTGELLIARGHSDFFAKVFPVVLANPLAHLLDRLAEALPGRLFVPLAPRLNLAHVAVWIALVTASLATGAKAGAFEAALHARYQTRHVVFDRPGQPPVCADNPAFCEPLSFGTELALWW